MKTHLIGATRKLAALGMLAMGTTMGLAEITISTVTIGDAGNASDPLNSGNVPGIGEVSYAYSIAKYETNLNQYTAFLNAVAATDTYNLYNESMETFLNTAGITRGGISGSYTYAVKGPSGTNPAGASSPGNRPVTFVSWFDAARFANWMANGQPTGAQDHSTTENGAYTLDGATSGLSFTKNAINPNTGTTTTWWIPSENEWYKSAYYDPSPSGPTDDYWMYPTRSDSSPGNTIGAGANQANYYAGDYSVTQSPSSSGSQNYLTDGGAFIGSASYYGTFDQGGNVTEWNDAAVGGARGLRGGSWYGSSIVSIDRNFNSPQSEGWSTGFRLASVPEPSMALALAGLGAVCLLMNRWRHTER